MNSRQASFHAPLDTHGGHYGCAWATQLYTRGCLTQPFERIGETHLFVGINEDVTRI